MTKKIKIGVIGAGHLGSLHIKILKTIDNIDFIGFFETSPDRRNEIVNQYQITAFSDLDNLLEKSEAVIIATPTPDHYLTAKNALMRNNHIFVEKPFTESADQARELIQIAAENGLKIQIGHIERFNPAILSLEKYDLKPRFIESHRLAQFQPRGSDVAVVLDLMIHDIDIILSLIKSPIKQVDANGVAIVSENIDIANARLKFQNGSVANVTASRISQKKMRKMRIFQDDAYISIDFLTGSSEIFRLAAENESSNNFVFSLGQIQKGAVQRNIVYEKPEVKEVNALKYEQELFIDSIRNNTEPVVDGNDGMNAIVVASMILEQIKSQNL